MGVYEVGREFTLMTHPREIHVCLELDCILVLD